MHVDAIAPGERVVLVDDLLATGGTSAAAAKLIAQAGGQLLEAQFLIELGFLSGRAQPRAGAGEGVFEVLKRYPGIADLPIGLTVPPEAEFRMPFGTRPPANLH